MNVTSSSLPCRHWPVRSYPWGKAEALCSSHSDVPALKRLLMELSLDDIKVHHPPLNPPSLWPPCLCTSRMWCGSMPTM